MFKILLIKEFQENLLSSRFIIALLLCITLIPLGIFVNLKAYQQRMADYQEAERLYQQRADGNINMNFHAEGYRPPSVLSIFSIGLEFYLPNKIVTSKSGDARIINESGVNNPPSLLFGKMDLLFNVSFVISLLALIFTFNTISGEKENGTLRLMISNSIPRWKIILAKILGNFIILFIPFLISILFSLIILSLSGTVQIFSASIFLPFLVILLATLLFILSMFNLGILVSAMTDRPINSIIVLLFVWTILVLSIPKMSPMIAEMIYPIKSQQVINLRKMLIRKNFDRESDRKRRELFDKVLTNLGLSPAGVSVPGKTEAERNAHAAYDEAKITIDQEYQERINTEISKLEQQYNNERNTQVSVAINLSRISPVSCYSYLVSEIAATGLLEMSNFMQHAKRFQNDVKAEIYDKYIIRSYGGINGGTATMIKYADGFDPQNVPVPQLVYNHTSLTEAMKKTWIDILLLCLFNIILFAGAYVAFLRYDVR